MDDPDLIHRARHGHADAWEALIHRYARALTALAHDRLGQAVAAQEAVRETFVVAHGRLEEVDRAEAVFAPWLYGLLREACARRLQKTGSGRYRLKDLAEKRAGDAPLTPLGTPTEDPAGAAVRAAVRGLSAPLREVVVLRYLGGAGLEEAAALLAITPAELSARLERALREMGRVLRPDDQRRGGRHPGGRHPGGRHADDDAAPRP